MPIDYARHAIFISINCMHDRATKISLQQFYYPPVYGGWAVFNYHSFTALILEDISSCTEHGSNFLIQF